MKNKKFYIKKIEVEFYKNKPYLHINFEGKYITEKLLKKMFKHYYFFINYSAGCSYDFDEPYYWLTYSEKNNLKYIHNNVHGENFVKLNSFNDLNLLKYFIDLVK